MGLPRLLFLKQLISKSALQFPKTLLKPTTHLSFINFSLNTREYHYHPTPQEQAFTEKLHSRIIQLVATSPNSSVTPFLDDWAQKGKKVRDPELQRLIRTLRSKKRFARALEVSEWMKSKRPGNSFAGDLAVHLDLIGKVHGVDAAERFFNEVDDHSEKMYGALLNCYVREGLVDKSLSHFQKMKDMGLANNPLNYNGIMTLYINTGQVEKLPEVLLEMEKNGVSPDNVTCRLCIKSCGLNSDFTTMEKLLEKLESQPDFSMDWKTYTIVANSYIKGGFKEKAKSFLQKAEERVNKDAVGYNYLISMYATLGDVSQVMRLWQKQRTSCTRQVNIDYMDVIGSLVKLGELQEAERIFQEWESADMLFDFRVPNVLLLGYTKRGLVDKAERMLEGLISRGKTPIPNSWSIIVGGHIEGGNMEKAVQCMQRALELVPQNQGWLPKPDYISSILDWLGDNKDIEEVEAFLKLLCTAVPMNREMYHSLLKANIRHGRKVDGILQRMKADDIEADVETDKILGSR